MANMRSLTNDERAKLARAYMRGGMAPYRAAREAGFTRVGLMEEAIKAMEQRETAEMDAQMAAAPVQAAPEKPRFGTDAPTCHKMVSEVQAVTQEEHTEKHSYPFRTAEDRKKLDEGLAVVSDRVLSMVQSRSFCVQLRQCTETQRVIKIGKNAGSGYLMFEESKLPELIAELQAMEELRKLQIGMTNMTKEDNPNACD